MNAVIYVLLYLAVGVIVARGWQAMAPEDWSFDDGFTAAPVVLWPFALVIFAVIVLNAGLRFLVNWRSKR